MIDLGSNTFHLAITSLDDAGQIHVIDSQKAGLRLAEVIEDSEIPEKFFKRAADTLLAMKSIGQSYHAEFRLVATQAIRAARNRLAFIEHIQKTTGLKLEIIDGVEEARLSFLGVYQGLSFGHDVVLSLDVGGASTEIAVGQTTECHYLSSLKMGALLLSKSFFFDRTPSIEALEELRQSIESRLVPIQEDLSSTSIQHAAVTSGTAKAMARMIHWDKSKGELDDPHGYRFSAAEVFAIEAELFQLVDPIRIAQRWKLDSRRADIILCGCAILATVTRLLNIEVWTVSTTGLREGVAIDTYARKGLLPSSRWLDLRWHSVQSFALKLRLDPHFAMSTSDLALRIYDQMLHFSEFSAMSGEAQFDRELLKASAYLLESGKFISYSGYHRHSYYLITESTLLGFTQEEKHLIALINRFARKSPARASKAENIPYLEENIARVNLLSSCLRIARCLLRTRQLKIRDFKISKQNGAFFLEVSTPPSIRMEAERLALKKEMKNLEKALDCRFDYQIMANPT